MIITFRTLFHILAIKCVQSQYKPLGTFSIDIHSNLLPSVSISTPKIFSSILHFLRTIINLGVLIREGVSGSYFMKHMYARQVNIAQV